MEADAQFVQTIVKGIVSQPDKVQINRKVDEMGVLIEVTVAPEDMGQLIGRSGTTAKAVRILARIFGMKNNARVNLRIVEPEGGKRASMQNNGPAPSTPTNNTDDAPTTQTAEKPAQIEDTGKTKDVDDVLKDIGV